MERLVEGYRLFRETFYSRNRALFDTLAREGQSPKAMIISCCDSRVDPGLIFSAEPGETFVLRNVANLVPPYAPARSLHGTSSAIEFAVRSLQVEHIVVLGHARCGGVKALLEGSAGDSEFVGSWMAIASAARDRALAAEDASPEERQRLCEHETVKVSLTNLMSFPWIRERVTAGLLQLHGWYFDIEGGRLWLLDETTGRFESA